MTEKRIEAHGRHQFGQPVGGCQCSPSPAEWPSENAKNAATGILSDVRINRGPPGCRDPKLAV